MAVAPPPSSSCPRLVAPDDGVGEEEDSRVEVDPLPSSGDITEEEQ